MKTTHSFISKHHHKLYLPFVFPVKPLSSSFFPHQVRSINAYLYFKSHFFCVLQHTYIHKLCILGEARREGRGRQGGTQLTLLPSKAEIEPLPPVPAPASCLPHLITEMSSPEGSLLLLTVLLYFPPAPSAAILVQGRESGWAGRNQV